MEDYKQILVAIDFAEECEKVVKQAASIATTNDAELNLIHVVQPLASTYSTGLAGGFVALQENDIEKSALSAAQDELAQVGVKWNIPLSNQHVVLGYPKDEIHRMAKELDADLIVIGSHGKRGVRLLLGSTANAVLHGATCDVLAVRV